MPTKPDQIKLELVTQDVYHANAIALSAGSIHGAAVRQYIKDFKAAKGDNVKLLGIIFDRLHKVNCLSTSEVSSFDPILSLLQDKKASITEALNVVQNVYNVLVEKRASPCAIALASIAKDSVYLIQETETVSKKKINWWAVLGADLGGAGTGALAGAPVAGVGAAVGAAAGAAIASGAAIVAQTT